MLAYAKKEIGFFLVSAAAALVGGYLFFSQSIDIGSKEEAYESLSSKISSSKKKLATLEREKRKNDEFFASHPHIRFVGSRKHFGNYLFERELKRKTKEYFGPTAMVKINMGKAKKDKSGFVSYPATIRFPYENKYRTEGYFSYLGEYMVDTERMKYRKGRFEIRCSFLGKD